MSSLICMRHCALNIPPNSKIEKTSLTLTPTGTVLAVRAVAETELFYRNDTTKYFPLH